MSNFRSFFQEKPPSSKLAVLLISFIALTGLLCLSFLEPNYLTLSGYPLDDAWIHAVYGRELARSGLLAYNPGIPSNGCTSPLWALFLSLPHLISTDVDLIIIMTKTIGFILHLLTAICLYFALIKVLKWEASVLAAAIVAFNPDLIAASVSGMEISLSTLIAALLLLTVQKGKYLFALFSLVAVLARPELTILIAALPIMIHVPFKKKCLFLLAGGIGSSISWAWSIFRNINLSGRPLPATYYAKVGTSSIPITWSLTKGFSELLEKLVIINSSILLTLILIISLWLIINQRSPLKWRIPSAAFLSGLLYCTISFILIPPIDPEAFYHQRYIFPAVPLLIISFIGVIEVLITKLNFSGKKAKMFLLVFLFLAFFSMFIHLPTRFHRLANDTRNIDDVQVAVGKYLSQAQAKEVAWVVDAGASRYFGNAFIVDLMGLNNYQLLGPKAQAFLDQYSPTYIEVVPGWNALDETSQKILRYIVFKPSTPYTVTSFKPMQVHLLYQGKPSHRGVIFFRGKSFNFSFARTNIQN
ncbi:MAG: hypothetical protein N3B16_05475 [Candidatus Aminicenantes bacterium]|nr:hypothetical protein [Candidatus Aminicenantes bacterium]